LETKKGAQTFPVLIPQELTPGTISVESTGTATAGGKSYEALKANTSDLEILLYLRLRHKLIRLEVPFRQSSRRPRIKLPTSLLLSQDSAAFHFSGNVVNPPCSAQLL